MLKLYDEVEQARRIIIKAERARADGHKGKRMRRIRGKYDFIVVKKEKAHDALSYFEKRISWIRLLGLRLGIMVK